MAKTNEQPSYEDLNAAATQTANENLRLKQIINQQNQKLQEMQMFNSFKRLDYIFKVIEFSSHFPKEYVEERIKEVQAFICTPTEIEEEETNAKGN